MKNYFGFADNNITALYQYDISNISYDNNGNIISINKGGINYTYNYYNGTNKLKNTGGSAEDYVYDANGNITSSFPKELDPIVYDPFTQMTSGITVSGSPTKTMSFNYSADNERVLKTENSGTTRNSNLYIRGNNSYPITEKINTNNALADKIYIYGPTGLIAFKDATATYFVIKDHLGSTRLLFKSTGSQYTTYDYSPFGSLMRATINGDVDYRFTGQEYDSEFGLYNFRARLYDSDIGIFYATDPAGQGFAPFAYAGNNPVICVDKDGRWFVIPMFLGAIMGERIGREKGATGLELFGYVFASMAINVGSAYLGSVVTGASSGIATGLNLINGSVAIPSGIGSGVSGFLNDLGMSTLADIESMGSKSFWAGFAGGFVKSFGSPYSALIGGFLSGGIGSDKAFIQNAIIGGIISVGDYYLERTARYSNKTGVAVLDNNREEIDREIRNAHLVGDEAGTLYEGDELVGGWKRSETKVENGIVRKTITFGTSSDMSIHSHTHPSLPSSDYDLSGYWRDSYLITPTTIYRFHRTNYFDVGSSSRYFMLNYNQINYFGRFLR